MTKQSIFDRAEALDEECHQEAEIAADAVPLPPDAGVWFIANTTLSYYHEPRTEAYAAAFNKAYNKRKALFAVVHAECASTGGHVYEAQDVDRCLICGYDRTTARETLSANLLRG
jgi:ribosomal protein L37E